MKAKSPTVSIKVSRAIHDQLTSDKKIAKKYTLQGLTEEYIIQGRRLVMEGIPPPKGGSERPPTLTQNEETKP